MKIVLKENFDPTIARDNGNYIAMLAGFDILIDHINNKEEANDRQDR